MNLFDRYKLGTHQLLNRVVMSPMTRARNADSIPNELNATYYGQRAGKHGAGLIITEGISISPTSTGVLYVPGLYTKEQVAGWKLTTDAVHKKGSILYAQLWHVGRVAHITNHPEGKPPVSPSNILAENTFAYAYNKSGVADFVQASRPQPLSETDINAIMDDYVQAARNAIEAGFDGIEIHGANGYLIEQFLSPIVNDRKDRYGGSIENRARFLLALIDRISAAIGSERVGVRLSPYSTLNDMPHYPEIEATYVYLAHKISLRNVSYVHFMNRLNTGGSDAWPPGFLDKFRALYPGTFLLAGGMTLERSIDLLGAGLVDLAVFGQPFIANPDLTARLKNNWPLTIPDRSTYYGGTEKGYTDYSALL